MEQNQGCCYGLDELNGLEIGKKSGDAVHVTH